MIKDITYKGQTFKLEIKWSGSTYCGLLSNGKSFCIPNEKINDIEFIKDLIKKEIEREVDLHKILHWDGNLDN